MPPHPSVGPICIVNSGHSSSVKLAGCLELCGTRRSAECAQCTLIVQQARQAGVATGHVGELLAAVQVAKAFGRKNECHGWLGLKYQTTPGCALLDLCTS